MSHYSNNPGFQPKHVSYHQNNQGRDTYIYDDNGGFNRLQMKVTFQSKNGTLNNKIVQSQDQRKAYQTPLVNYFSDGTGRDQYIKYNHGGLCKNQRYTADVFISTLRDNQKIQNFSSDDFYLHSQFMKSKSDYLKNKALFGSQTQLIDRLNQPKKTHNLPKLQKQ